MSTQYPSQCICLLNIPHNVFYQHSRLPSWLLGFPNLFTFMPKEKLAKGNYLVLNKVWTHTHAHTKPRPNHSTNPDFIITPTILGIYHHPMHSIYKHTKTHNLNNTQMAHIGLEPKSSHTIKYSQPLELVLFHVIVPHINYLNVSNTRHN